MHVIVYCLVLSLHTVSTLFNHLQTTCYFRRNTVDKLRSLHNMTDPAQYVLSYVKSQSKHFKSETIKDFPHGFNGILGRVIEWMDYCKQVAEDRANISGSDRKGMPDTENFYLNPFFLSESQNVGNHHHSTTSY